MFYFLILTLKSQIPKDNLHNVSIKSSRGEVYHHDMDKKQISTLWLDQYSTRYYHCYDYLYMLTVIPESFTLNGVQVRVRLVCIRNNLFLKTEPLENEDNVITLSRSTKIGIIVTNSLLLIFMFASFILIVLYVNKKTRLSSLGKDKKDDIEEKSENSKEKNDNSTEKSENPEDIKL